MFFRSWKTVWRFAEFVAKICETFFNFRKPNITVFNIQLNLLLADQRPNHLQYVLEFASLIHMRTQLPRTSATLVAHLANWLKTNEGLDVGVKLAAPLNALCTASQFELFLNGTY